MQQDAVSVRTLATVYHIPGMLAWLLSSSAPPYLLLLGRFIQGELHNKASALKRLFCFLIHFIFM